MELLANGGRHREIAHFAKESAICGGHVENGIVKNARQKLVSVIRHGKRERNGLRRRNAISQEKLIMKRILPEIPFLKNSTGNYVHFSSVATTAKILSRVLAVAKVFHVFCCVKIPPKLKTSHLIYFFLTRFHAKTAAGAAKILLRHGLFSSKIKLNPFSYNADRISPHFTVGCTKNIIWGRGGAQSLVPRTRL